ncbi:MAG: exo-alpha-sialidase [Chromatiales bacterium]|nr:MAG: exo-alpha-sialidase [Chromatiales bacterium]
MFVNWADLPSVTALSDDHWLAHWLRYSADKTYSYDVVVSQSFDGGDTWNEATATHTDGTPTEHGFVSVLPDDNGALLIWLDGRNTPDSSMTLRSAVITPQSGRSSEQEIDNSVCDCCQTDIALAASGPIAVYRDRTQEEIRDIYLSRRIDGQWQPGTRVFADNWHIAGCPVNGPSIIADGERVTVAWFSAADDKPVVRAVLSSDSGQSFGEPIEIASGRVAGYVGLVAVTDNAAVVSWVAKADNGENSLRMRRVSAKGAAGPVVEVGRTNQIRVFPQLAYADGYLYLAWTSNVEGTSQLKTARLSVNAST